MITQTGGITSYCAIETGPLVRWSSAVWRMQGSVDGRSQGITPEKAVQKGRNVSNALSVCGSGDFLFRWQEWQRRKRTGNIRRAFRLILTVCFSIPEFVRFLILSRTMSLPMLPACAGRCCPMLSGWLTPACLPQCVLQRGCLSFTTGSAASDFVNALQKRRSKVTGSEAVHRIWSR